MNSIELYNVSLDYYLDNEDAYSFKNALLNFYAKAKKPTEVTFRALDNLSFTVPRGEKLGIIGLNGSGKTTLLKTLSGIFKPTEGKVIINDRVTPLLDFHTGFEENLTGLENIIIRLMFLGLSKIEAQAKIPDVVEFAELGDFIYQPIRTYSAGMVMRLAFGTSTAINPEILIADEVIGTGDAKFAAKAKNRLENFLSGECTVVLTSHSMELIRNFCNRVILLHKGKIVIDGSVEEVIKEYQKYI